MKKRLNKKGFTLIELIVVIAILAILAAILIPSLTDYIRKANESKNGANARSLYTQTQLEVSTTEPNVTTLTSGTADAASGLTCTWTIVTDVVTNFACTKDGKTYSAATGWSAN